MKCTTITTEEINMNERLCERCELPLFEGEEVICEICEENLNENTN